MGLGRVSAGCRRIDGAGPPAKIHYGLPESRTRARVSPSKCEHQARRKQTKERDQAIIQAVAGGQSMRSVAREFEVEHSTVVRILGRDAPLFARPAPLTLTRPWEAEGVSRRTWERHRDASGARTKQVSPEI